MDIERAFLADIVASPDDDAVRLIYADWLDDHGRPDRAEFIRLQVASSRLAPDDPRRAANAGRERELLAEHQDEWLEPFGPLLLAEEDVRDWDVREPMQVFRRGFLEAAALEIDRFAEFAPILFAAEPVRDVWLPYTNYAGHEALAASPYLARFRTLELVPGFFDDVAMLLGSPKLGALEVLRMHPSEDNNHIGPEALEALVANPVIRLRGLDLAGNIEWPGDEMVVELSRAPWLSGLTHLCLRGVDLGDDGAHTIASLAELGHLRVLDLSGNYLGDDGLVALAESRHLARLERLDLRDYHGDGGEEAMARLRARFGDRLVT